MDNAFWIEGDCPSDAKPVPSRSDLQASSQQRVREILNDPDVRKMVNTEVEKAHEASADEVNDLQKGVRKVASLLMEEDHTKQYESHIIQAKLQRKFGVNSTKMDALLLHECARQIGIDLHGDITAPNMNVDEGGWGDDDDEELEAVDHIVAGLLQNHGTTVLAAAAGTGKTEAACDLIVSIVERRGWFPFVDVPTNYDGRKVLFIASDMDDGARTQMRAAFRRAGVTDTGWLRDNVKLICPDSKRGESAWTATLKNLRRLHDLLKGDQFGLVVIDSFRAITAGTQWDSTHNEKVMMLMKLLKAIVTPHAALLIIHHTGEERSSGRGAHVTEMASAKALGQIVDIVAIMKQGTKDDGSIADFKRLHGVKVRGGFLPYECHLTRDLNTGQMVLNTGSLSSETPEAEKILKWIDEGEVINGRKIPVSSQKIAQWMKIENSTASNYASAMHSSGLIRAKGHGWLLTAKGNKHLENLTKGIFISAKASPISGEEEMDF